METDSQDGPKQKVLSRSYSTLNICCLIQNLEIIEFSDFWTALIPFHQSGITLWLPKALLAQVGLLAKAGFSACHHKYDYSKHIYPTEP